MNCKPGDLAIRVSVSIGGNSMPVGSIVRCIKYVGRARHNLSGKYAPDFWLVEYAGRTICHITGAPLGLPDSDLRPIRDPGDDAQDETLQWLPVPKLTKNVDKVVKDTAKGLQKEKV